MNKLNIEKQETAIAALVEGTSIRSVERMTGIHRDTIMRLMVRTGEKCQALMDSEMPFHVKGCKWMSCGALSERNSAMCSQKTI